MGASRVSAHGFAPAELVLVTDRAHALYDPSVELPVNAGLVASMRLVGWFGSIVVTKDSKTGQPLVADGRQRVKAARVLAEDGLPGFRVLGIYREWGKPGAMVAIGAAANEHRAVRGILERATAAKRLRDEYGYAEADICAVFGVGVGTLANWRGLLEAPALVLTAVAEGKIPVTAAYRLAALPEAKQEAAVARALEGSTTARVRDVVASKRPTAKAMREIAEQLPTRGDSETAGWGTCLRWVLGDDDELPARVRAMLGRPE